MYMKITRKRLNKIRNMKNKVLENIRKVERKKKRTLRSRKINLKKRTMRHRMKEVTKFKMQLKVIINKFKI